MEKNNSLILVINCGSSSLKFAVFPVGEPTPLATGLAEALGHADSRIAIKVGAEKTTTPLNGGDHAVALDNVLAMLAQHDWLKAITGVGHRFVHGGEKFTQSVVITPSVLADLDKTVNLAPLHNPAHLLGVRTAIAKLPGVPQIAVFDTSFHQTMPEEAYLYAIPMQLYRDHGLRRYGFHGTSHRYVSTEAVRMLGLDPEDHGIIVAHLGNGASVSAVKNGKCVDTSMGLTPLEGLVMGTRSGDIDPGALFYLARNAGYTIYTLDTLLNKQSGLLGVSELSNDCRTLEEAATHGHEGANRALAVFAHRLAKYIGGLAMALHRLDAVVFTGGIGENSERVREMTIQRLRPFGLTINPALNGAAIRGMSGIITSSRKPVAAVIPTNEEWMIANDTATLINQTKAC